MIALPLLNTFYVVKYFTKPIIYLAPVLMEACRRAIIAPFRTWRSCWKGSLLSRQEVDTASEST
jgi:hypothetical protein